MPDIIIYIYFFIYIINFPVFFNKERRMKMRKSEQIFLKKLSCLTCQKSSSTLNTTEITELSWTGTKRKFSPTLSTKMNNKNQNLIIWRYISVGITFSFRFGNFKFVYYILNAKILYIPISLRGVFYIDYLFFSIFYYLFWYLINFDNFCGLLMK